MANFFLTDVYGQNHTMLPYVKGLSLQLHITAVCDQQCKHCYMYNSPYYRPQIEHPLSAAEFCSLIDEYFAFQHEFHCSGGLIAITGGDPVLSPYFWDILAHIHSRQEPGFVVVLGNPTHIHEEEALRLRQLGVFSYQISIDGMKPLHDYFRKPGSFDDSIRALKVLHNAGLMTTVSFTVSKKNAPDLIPLYDFLSAQDYVDSFGFNRMIPTGNGKQIADDMFTPLEYRQFLFDVYRHEVLHASGLIIAKKEQLWRPLLYELGLVDPVCTDSRYRFYAGCSCGTGAISFLADGTMFPCRRMDVPSGKYPEHSFRDLYIHNPLTQKFRNHEEFSGCNQCEVNTICRGCPSMKYAATGDFYAPDPYCWRVNGNE